MTMKKYIYIFCFVLLGITGCADFIDVRPENATTYTNYFKTQKDAEALLNGIMFDMRQSVSLRNTADIVDDNVNFTIANNLEPVVNLSSFMGYGDLIYQANLILDNAHRFEIPEEELKPYLLQAYFAKGVAYFFLAMRFGDAPITKSSTSFEKLPQSPVSEVLDEAEKWALKAMDLPRYEELVQQTPEPRMKQYGSKGAAAALLAHLYAWRAGVEGKRLGEGGGVLPDDY